MVLAPELVAFDVEALSMLLDESFVSVVVDDFGTVIDDAVDNTVSTLNDRVVDDDCCVVDDFEAVF